MPLTNRREIVRRYYATFHTADRGAVEALLAPHFRFTSPWDDNLDRHAFFERCWSAMAGTFEPLKLDKLVEDEDEVVVFYDGRSKDGASFRNMERLRFDGDRIAAVEVFFGKPQGAPAIRPEDEIRTLLEQRKEAYSVRDARLVEAKHVEAPEVFPLAPPLVMEGSFAPTLESWLKTWTDLEWETRDPHIAVSGDVAFVAALEHMLGEQKGEHVDLWFRTTLGLKKLRGAWKIVHEHQSVPFVMDGTAKAAIDLQPPEARRAAREERPGLN